MKFSEQDLENLRTKQLANIIRKLNSGKTLTGREETLLAQSRVGGSPQAASAFAATWDELASRLGVTRKSIQNWRARPDLAGQLPSPRADGRHDVAAWSKAMVDLRLARADEDEPGEFPSGSVTDWKRRREELECKKREIELEQLQGRLIEASDLEFAIGQMLAGITAALHHLPGSAARFLVGIRDVHVIQSKLEAEANGVLQRLNAARYLDDCVGQVVAELPGLDDLTRGALVVAIQQVLQRVGARAIADATGAGGPAIPSEGSAVAEAEFLAEPPRFGRRIFALQLSSAEESNPEPPPGADETPAGARPAPATKEKARKRGRPAGASKTPRRTTKPRPA